MENRYLPRTLLLLTTIAFVLAPAFTPAFRGYDPALFPVLIDRPAIQPQVTPLDLGLDLIRG